MKDHHKDIALLLKVAERSGKVDRFMFIRKLNPPLVLELAQICQDIEMSEIAAKAHGKRNTNEDFEKFIKACTPEKIKNLCQKAIYLSNEDKLKKIALKVVKISI